MRETEKYYIIDDDKELNELLNIFGIDLIPRPNKRTVKMEKKEYISKDAPKIRKVIIVPPKTIILWDDNTRTITKSIEGDAYDPAVGVAYCLLKKCMGKNYYRQIVKILKNAEYPTCEKVKIMGE